MAVITLNATALLRMLLGTWDHDVVGTWDHDVAKDVGP